MVTRRGRRGPRFAGRRPRRPVEWFDTLVDLSLAASTQNGTVLTTNILDAVKKGATIVRTIVDLWYSVNALNQNSICDLGLVMINDDAIGSGSFPDPQTVTDKPGWMLRKRVVIQGSEENVPESNHFVFDLKTSRILAGDDMDLILITNNNAGGQVNIKGLVRVLIKLR